LREVFGHPDVEVSWKKAVLSGGPAPSTADLIERVYRGGYPEPAISSGMDVRLWHSSYVQTYIERDVRTLRAVADLGDLQRFLFALAARTGAVINFQDLSRDLGLTGKTVKAWVTILEAGGQVLTLKS